MVSDIDTDTYNYIELCNFFKLLVVPRVSVHVVFMLYMSVFRIRVSYANIINAMNYKISGLKESHFLCEQSFQVINRMCQL